MSSVFRAETSLGSWEYLIESQCQNHAALFPPNDALHSQQIWIRKPARQGLIYVHPDPYRIDTAVALEAPWEVFEPNKDSALFSLRADRPRPRIVDREWIDLKMLKDWYGKCESSHEASCGSVLLDLTISSRPLLLIDTHQRCLVPGDTSYHYFALSYVWGRANAVLTTKATVELFSKPGALTRNSATARLPRTIDEAIELTKALGACYLWVDALCIVQDSGDKVDQLNAMASLFANANLTIVAAQGEDANTGFRGLREISKPRHAKQRIASLLPDRELVKPSSKHVWNDSLLRPWSTRAWTFQEAICSRRVLYFAHDSVRWCCKTARWSEESESPDCVLTYADAERRQLSLASPQLSASLLPTLYEYEALVNGFNCRKLTYPEDALSAFAGVATRLGEKFSRGLISGLPEDFFDICLLWRPLRRLGPARRRQSKMTSENCGLPTWSWVSWETEVSWPYTWNRNNDPAGPVPILLGNMRPFYQIQIHHSTQQGSKTPIDGSWFNFVRAALDKQVPSGWSSHKVSELEIQDYGVSEDAMFFTHELDRSVDFCFPVRVCDELQPPRTAELLHFRTSSGRFTLGETRRCMTRIHTLDGAAAGTLWQHDEADKDYVRAMGGPLSDRLSIELVAILGCIIPKDNGVIWDASDISVRDFVDNDTEPSRTEEVYNVMWIERDKGGIAHRKATGEVKRQVWEMNALESVDIVLG